MRFAIARDLVMSGVTILRRGTLVEGTVTRSERSIAGEKHARLDLSAVNIALAPNLQLRLREKWQQTKDQKTQQVAAGILAAPFAVLLAPLLIAEAIDNHNGGKATGEDVAYASCSLRTFYVATDTMIDVASLNPSAAGPPLPLQEICGKTWEPFCRNTAAKSAPNLRCTRKTPDAIPAIAPAITPAISPVLPGAATSE